VICCVVRSTVTRPTSDSRSTAVGCDSEKVTYSWLIPTARPSRSAPSTSRWICATSAPHSLRALLRTVSKTSSWEDAEPARTDSTSTIAASCARGPG